MKKHYIVGLIVCFYLSTCLLVAQQPPAKTGATPQPPAKTTTPPEKSSPNKNTSNTEMLVTYTFDGVRIEGDYYPAAEGKMKTAPCLIMVHAVGPKHLAASRADFGKLPETLQKLGYAVAVIDMRGYGKSKTVDSKFWNTHRPRTKNMEVIEGKDYATSADMLEMIYDLTAVKIWLNTKNNAKECNSHAVGVIGVEQGGIIALAWAANESIDPNRTKTVTAQAGGGNNNNGFNNNNNGFNNGIGNNGLRNNGFGNFGNNGFNNNGTGNNPQGNQGNNIPRYEGEDITCIVSISTTNRLNDALNYSLLESWITYLRDHQVASMAIYGALDKDANTFWSKAGLWAKPAGDKFRFKYSGVKPVKGTSLVGMKLLTNDTLNVGKMLEDYLDEALKKAAVSRLWSEQAGYDRPMPIDFSRLLR